MTEFENDDQSVAVALLGHRKSRGLTLAQLAAQTGISTAHLSRIEKGERMPTISILLQLSRAYGIPLGELVGETRSGDSAYVSRAADRVSRPLGDTVITTMSSSQGSSRLQAITIELPPQAHTVPISHSGEEWIYALQGTVDVTVSGELYRLEPNDSIHFDATREHHLSNPRPDAATLIVVSTVVPSPSHHHQGD